MSRYSKRVIGKDRYVIRMKVSARDAIKALSSINHRTFQRGLQKHWHTYRHADGTDHASAQSICWLFCWAYSGQNSPKARDQTRRVFNHIFDPSFGWLCKQLPKKDADRLRYRASGGVDLSTEDEFRRLLCG